MQCQIYQLCDVSIINEKNNFRRITNTWKIVCTHMYSSNERRAQRPLNKKNYLSGNCKFSFTSNKHKQKKKKNQTSFSG